MRTSNEGKPQTGISFLLIDMKSPGVTVRPIIMLDGEPEVNEVFFDNVEVPAENLIGEENKGWTYAKHLLAHERTNIADVNRAKRELERLKRIAKAEGVYDDARFRDQIALLEVDVVALEMMVLRVLSAEKSGKQSARHRRPAEDPRQRDPAALHRADDAGRRALQPCPIVREAMEAGWQGDHVGAAHCAPLAGTYFNMRKTTIYGGSNEVQRNIVARRVLGLSSRRQTMDFDFTDDQESLRDAVRRWVDKGYGFERRHAHRQGRRLDARRLLAELAELGLTGLAVPEAHGGMGFGAVEAMVVMEELGRGLVNAPYAAGALVAPHAARRRARRAAGARGCRSIADGEALVVLAHQERARALPARPRGHAAAQAAGGSWQLSGTKSVVPAGDEADAFIVPARVGGAVDDAAGIALFLVERGATASQVRGYPTQDGARAAELTLADAAGRR